MDHVLGETPVLLGGRGVGHTTLSDLRGQVMPPRIFFTKRKYEWREA